MALDPVTGMYEDQPSPFPDGMFGGALKTNNAFIAQRSADDVNTKRMLLQHQLELSNDREGGALKDDADKRAAFEDQRVREEQFRNYVQQNPQASIEDLSRQSLAYGAKETGALSTMSNNQSLAAYRQAQMDNLAVDNKAKTLELAGKEAKNFLDLGIPPMKVADAIGKKYPDVPPEYLDEIRAMGSKAAPAVEATINARNAKAGKDNRPPVVKPPAAKDEKTNARILDLQLRKAPLVKAASNDDGSHSPAEVENAKTSLAQIDAEISRLKALIAPAAAAPAPSDQFGALTKTPPPAAVNTATTTMKPPRFKPQPAPGKPDGKTGQGKLLDGSGTIIPIVVRNGMWVEAN